MRKNGHRTSATTALSAHRLSRRAALAGMAAFAPCAALAPFAALAPSAALANPLFATRRRDGLYEFKERAPILELERLVSTPLIIDRFDILEAGGESVILRVIAKDGTYGATAASPTKWAEIRPLIVNLVKPFLIGKDARQLEQHLWAFSRRQYEYAGAPMWNAWGHAECAVLDLLGNSAGLRVSDLLGGTRRTEIPFYISSNSRSGAPEAEVEALGVALQTSGCKGVKIKVGGRMSRDVDARPGWTNTIVRETRRRLGDDITIYADANGSYDAPTALEVARLLEDHDVAMFEEPCPGDDMIMTGQVTSALRGRRFKRSKLLIASGENEGNPTLWRQWIDGRHLDVAQPDPQYGGGMIHCIAIARLCSAAGLKFNPHWPREGAEQAPLVHLCAAAPELWGLQEYRLRPRPHPYGPISDYRLENGMMKLPDAPGFGVRYDEAIWARAKPL